MDRTLNGNGYTFRESAGIVKGHSVRNARNQTVRPTMKTGFPRLNIGAENVMMIHSSDEESLNYLYKKVGILLRA